MLSKRQLLKVLGGSLTIGALPLRVLSSENDLSSAAIKSDLALLQRVYSTLHPGLYRYSTRAQIDARFATTAQMFNEPSTLSSFYLELSKLLASVRCGHSYANFYSQTERVQKALFTGRNRIPFQFIWLNNVMVITNPAGVVGLERGARVLKINGLPTRQILETLLPYVRADGHNVGKQASLLSVNRDEGFQTFDVFYGLQYAPTEIFRIEGILPTGRSFNLLLPAIDLAARRAMTASPALADTAPVWSLEVGREGTATMIMPTWGLYRTKWDWKAWLATSFTQIKTAQTRKLIIDLRGNEGGRDDCGPEILGYLTTTALPPQKGQRRVRYQKIPGDLNPVLETWDDSFRDWGTKVVARPDGMFDLIDEGGRSGADVTPKSPHFDGKVIVLTDASNSSATLQFCQMLRANDLGLIVGGTTGGNLRGINAEKFVFCRLPATGLEVDVPLVGFFPEGSPADSGLVPDHVIINTWRDIASQTDKVMVKALSL